MFGVTGNDPVRTPFQGGFIVDPNPGLQAWAVIFYRFAVIGNILASLFFTQSAMGAQPSVNNPLSTQETTIQPESIVSGYPVEPAYTLSRYDEDYSFLANPANRTEPLDLIKYTPLLDLGPLYFVTVGADIREQ